MRKFKKSLTLLSAAVALCSNGYADFHKDFSIENLYTIGTDTVNGEIYTNINLKDASYEGVPGNPQLPHFTYYLYVPYGQKVENVGFEIIKSRTLHLDNNVYPTQENFIVEKPKFSSPNESIYNSSLEFPNERFTFEVEKELGFLEIVKVKVFPCSYNPQKEELQIADSYSIVVKTVQSEENKKVLHKLHANYISDFAHNLRFNVTNPDMIEDNIEEIISEHIQKESLRSSASWGVPFYEYVIITRRNLIPAFNQLLTWKRQKGLNAGAVAVEDILNDPASTGGDLISGINDDAGKIRKYLRASKEAGIGKYVLLGGMSNIVPIRYGWYNHDSWGDTPSDFYFSNLEGNWYKDKTISGRYGKETDDIKANGNGCFLYVGRLLCRTAEDIERWTKKQLIYEQNPGLGDYSYLGRALFTEADNIVTPYTAKMQGKLPNYIVATTIKETPNMTEGTPTGPKAEDVIEQINNIKYGLLTNGNHGSPCTYALATIGKNEYIEGSKYQIISADLYDEIDNANGEKVLYSTKHELRNGFDNLTNFNYPAIMYSISCVNMPFDDYKNFFSEHGMRNLGEAFLCMNQGGGIAYLGNTRSIYTASAPILYENFLGEIKIGRECRLGILEYYSKKNFNNHSTIITHNLAGCPETYFWEAAPKKFGSISISPDGNGSIWVNNVNLNNAIVCVTSANDGGVSYRKTSKITNSNKNPKFTNVPNDYVVVVTLDGYIPYIYHSNECTIQKETFAGTETRDCKNIVAGAHVTTNKPEGDVTIKSGANVTFDAQNTTRIEGGFQVKTGGQLKIK